ncbi:flagellar brake protein [Thermodesulfatator atlanticus]|uniref:flagellar brake protein n=1 Tax=Thermodesulfatator atlanticus TaxID=501497 RepID=UPI0003B3EDA6|nr:PilZ domain-containing protein [Thermodesulfatator atlanticus]
MSWTYFEQGYERTTDRRIIDILLDDLKENAYWVQIAAAGFRSGPTILVDKNKNRLFFDLPRPWREGLQVVRVTYQDKDKIYYTFRVKVLETDHKERLIITNFPQEYFRLERRRFYRVPTPDGSVAHFKFKGKEYQADIVNISASGMAIVLPRQTRLIVGEDIEDVVLKLNVSLNKPYDHELRIKKARIVREMPRGAGRYLYGIDFLIEKENEREPFLRYTIKREIELRKS